MERDGFGRPRQVAQYLRMSTDMQEYSIANQQDAIAKFAAEHRMEVVRTYLDQGRSGLGIRRRGGLKELIRDVHSDRRGFSAVLVYDVSRWGRFQDTDESAFYEFICRRAGVPIIYCAELFDSISTSPMDAVIKGIKRAMAAEYSRELGEKVVASKRRVARLGFHASGKSPFGFQRLLVDGARRPKCVMPDGIRKETKTDRVLLTRGLRREVTTVRNIFRWYVHDGVGTTEIARRLNKRGCTTKMGARWNANSVNYVLRYQVYAGTAFYNRKTARLGARPAWNPTTDWIAIPVSDPLVSVEDFEHARELRKTRRPPKYSDDQMLGALRALLQKEGRLDPKLIDHSTLTPGATTYSRRFGSLFGAYRLIGYEYADRKHTDRAERSLRAMGFRDKLVRATRDSLERAGFACRMSEHSRSKVFANGVPVSVLCRRATKKARRTNFATARWGLLTLVGVTVHDGSTLISFVVLDRITEDRFEFDRTGDAIRCVVERARLAKENLANARNGWRKKKLMQASSGSL